MRRAEGGREPHVLLSEAAPVFSPLPHERHFCPALKYIALHLLLMRLGLPRFFLLPCPPPRFAGNRLIFRPDPQIFIPSRLTENLRGSVRASTKRRSRAKRLKSTTFCDVSVGTGHVPCSCTCLKVRETSFLLRASGFPEAIVELFPPFVIADRFKTLVISKRV